uniref:Uncharacterized protein n=1 Tax=Echeneis naucrates TaxID=173247 RepID=A0A665V6A1_ECHNA
MLSDPLSFSVVILVCSPNNPTCLSFWDMRKCLYVDHKNVFACTQGLLTSGVEFESLPAAYLSLFLGYAEMFILLTCSFTST